MNKSFTLWTRRVKPRIYRGQDGYIILDGLQTVAMIIKSYFANDYVTLRTINQSPRAYTIKRHD